MANIQQAARWMEEGKKVTLTGQEHAYVYEMDTYECMSEVDRGFQLTISMVDILSDDWKIAE